MRKVEIFDPAMCCPTGVCGPSVDPELTRVASAIFLLEKKGFDIKRYNLANDPLLFAENEEVNKLLHENGPDALPITLLDGEVVKTGSYPTNDVLANWFGMNIEDLIKKPKNLLEINLKPLK